MGEGQRDVDKQPGYPGSWRRELGLTRQILRAHYVMLRLAVLSTTVRNQAAVCLPSLVPRRLALRQSLTLLVGDRR